MPKSTKTTKPPARAVVKIGDKVTQYAASNRADNTETAYASAWKGFTSWCEQHGLEPLPAASSTVIDYLNSKADAGAKASTMDVHRAAIRSVHRLAGYADPTDTDDVATILKGIRRKKGKAPKKKAPITADDLRAMVASLPDNMTGKRDRALILTGFAGAFRRSELVAVDVNDVRISAELRITVGHGKTEQDRRGLVKSIPAVQSKELDAIQAMRVWLEAAAIKSGPVFRQIDRWGNVREDRLTPQSVALILKRAAQAAGLEPRQFSGHSLRSGFMTAAADGGAMEWEIQEQTCHKDTRMLRGYVQAAGRGATRAVLAAVNGRPKETDEDKGG